MSERRCAACGANQNLRRVEDGVWLCDPDPPPRPASCYREWRNSQGDRTGTLRRHAFALVGKLGMDDQDRRAFTEQVLKERGKNACSWSPKAEHPLTDRDFDRLIQHLEGGLLIVELYRSQHMLVPSSLSETGEEP